MCRLMALIKSLQSQECFSSTMVNVIICIGIASNDDPDLFRIFKALKADVLINCNGFKIKYIRTPHVCISARFSKCHRGLNYFYFKSFVLPKNSRT